MQRMQRMLSQTGSVFWITAALSAALIVWGTFFTSNFSTVVTATFEFTIANLSWFYMLVTTFFLLFCIWLAFSRYGRIRLGKDGEEPEFGWFSWVAMLFQAGMGLAVVFWGGAEPVTHYADPPFGAAEANTPEAAQLAMQYSFFHWGLHAWAVFAVTGLAVAYFNYRKDTNGVISPILYPILGERVNGPIGKAVDVLAIFVTLVGIAVSLGLGGLQIGAGFQEALGFTNVLSLQLIIIAVTAVAYMLSAATPLEKGVKWLSNISMVVGAFLAIYFIAVGPSILMVNAFVQGIGDYLGALIPMSFTMGSFASDTDFLSKFTAFYWGWWIAWAPFVGVFAARISRGRTIREFVAGILVVPSLICMAWFAIAGASGIELDRTLGGTLSAAAQADPAAGFFVFLQYVSFPLFTSLVTLFLLWIFFVAGADAGTIVLGSMSADGVKEPNRFIRLVWGVVIGALAAVLLLSGGIEPLQQAAALVGLPFAIVMLFICYALYKALRADYHEQDEQEEGPQEPAPTREPATPPSPALRMQAQRPGTAEGPAGEPTPGK